MTLLEKLSNLAVIIVAVAVIGTKISERLAPADTPVAQVHLAQRFMGKPLPLPEALATGKNGTITLFISKQCRFCTDSMLFYRRLKGYTSSQACETKLVAIGPGDHESREDIQEYLAGHHLPVDGIAMVNFHGLNVTGTPTLVLRDGARLVQGVWVGKLSEAGEKEVLSKVGSFCHT